MPPSLASDIAPREGSTEGPGQGTVVPALLQVDGLVKRYRLPAERLFAPAPTVEALRGVSFEMHAGRSLGIVGESGSGKSTLARQVMALEAPSAGGVRLLGRDLNALPAAELREARRDLQMVFQDPYGSLDPRQRIERIVAEPLRAAGSQARRARVVEALDAVGLRPADAAKYPHEFSGGQRQRIAIARALITRPKLIVADEPVSALDVSVQAQVLNLLADLKATFGVTYLFISHDIAVVDHVADDVAVLHAGRIVERGPPDVLFRAAAHPYTRALMASMPTFGDGGASMAASPSALAPTATPSAEPVMADAPPAPDGCSYAPRCAHRQPRCSAEAPALRLLDNPAATGHLAACHFAESVMAFGPVSGEFA